MTTQKAFANYQEIVDFHTESSTSSVIGIHTPCSDRPVKMLSGFWKQFKKVKYVGCDLSLVPAAQLPADPLQVSYDSGEPTIDPRDMLNPIMFKGCHGNDLGVILNEIYGSVPTAKLLSDNAIMQRVGSSDSIEQNKFDTSNAIVGNDFVEALYYRCLTDNTWLKAHPQRGFRKKGLHPRVYSVATNHQYAFVPRSEDGNNGSLGHTSPPVLEDNTVAVGKCVGTLGHYGSSSNWATEIEATKPPGIPVFNTTSLKYDVDPDYSQTYFFTPRTQRLGWLDTRAPVGTHPKGLTDALNGEAIHDRNVLDAMWQANQSVPSCIPKIFMGLILLSPSYKTEMYYRLVLNHHFAFAGFRGAGEFLEDEGESYDFGAYENFESA